MHHHHPQPIASSSRFTLLHPGSHYRQPLPLPRMMDPYYDDDEQLVPLSPRSRPTQLLPLHPNQLQHAGYQLPFNYNPHSHQRAYPVYHTQQQQQQQYYVPQSHPMVYAPGPAPTVALGASQPEEKDSDGYPVHQCPKCEKQYKGKHGRSIWRRHLQDKHGIPLSMQVRRSRWDADPNRPVSGEDKRQRMLESKRRWAAKKRAERRSAKRGAHDGSPNEDDEELDEEQEREWQLHLEREDTATAASVEPTRSRSSSTAKASAPKMARSNSNASRSSRGSAMARTASNTSAQSVQMQDVKPVEHPPYPPFAGLDRPRVHPVSSRPQLQAQTAELEPANEQPPPERMPEDNPAPLQVEAQNALSSMPAPAAEAAASLLIMQSSPANRSVLAPAIDLGSGSQSKDLFVSAGVRGSSPICSPADKRPEPRYVDQRVDTTPTPLRMFGGRQSAALKSRVVSVSHSDDDPFCPPGLAASSSSRGAPSSSTKTPTPLTPMTPNVLSTNHRILNTQMHTRARPPPPPFPRDAWAKDASASAATPSKHFQPTPLRYQSSPHWQLSSPNGLSLTHSLGLAPSAPLMPETPGWAEMLVGRTPDQRRGVKRQPPMSAERNRWSDE